MKVHRWAGALVVAAALVGITPGVSGGQATPEARSISGTIRGIDGRFVNAQISLVLRRSDGTFIGMNGQPSRPGDYAAVISMNPTAPLEGLDTGGDDTWSFDDIPANATDFTFEVYPRAPGSGEGNWTNYGGVSKRRVPIPAAGLANVRLRLPLNCDVPGGTTGSIRIKRFHNGQPAGSMDRFLALSENNPPSGIQGFRALRTIPAGDTVHDFDGIAPDQRYSVNIYTPGNDLHAFYEVPVRTCQTTTLYAYTGSPRPTIPGRFTRLGASESGAYFPVPGDFNGDGKDDIFWYAPSANNDKLSFSTGTGNTFTNQAAPVGGGYRPVPGDFNGDGVDDLFFYGPGSAPDLLWRFAPGGTYTPIAQSAGGSSSTWPVSGDYDANGYDDILFATPGRLSTIRRYQQGGYTNGSAQVPSSSQVRAGDINGDFRTDLLWHNASTGAVKLWFGRLDGTFLTASETVGRGVAYRPILADISGDFRADVIWYAPGSQADRLWRGRALTNPYFAKESIDLAVGGNYSPIPGDWNGDGTVDVFWYASGAAADSIWRMNLSGWIPQVG